jgi:ligand-binding sensor domain-containing protein
MYHKHFIFSIVCFLFFAVFFEAHSQLPVGSWRAHFAYGRSIRVTEAGERIYNASRQGLFYLDKNDNSIGTLTKINGLSDVDISAVSYSANNQVLIVGYKNGNLDLVFPRQIVNISDIKRLQTAGRKSISNLLFIDDKVYLACGFGVVVIDLERKEISDTWYIGPGGISLEVLDVETDGTYLYAATVEGVYYADLNSPNLSDFSAWSRINSLPEPNVAYKYVKWFGSRLYLVKEDTSGNEIVLVDEGSSWQTFLTANGLVRSLKVSSGILLVVDQQSTRGFNSSGSIILDLSDYGSGTPNPMDAIYSSDQTLWVADNFNGLVRYSGGMTQSMIPKGPGTENAFHLSVSSNKVFVSGGGYDYARVNLYRNGEMIIYEDDDYVTVFDLDVRDLVRVLPHPRLKDISYAATWGFGIIEYDRFFPQNVYNPSNSTLETIIPGDYCRISGMVFDNQENLWVANTSVPNPVSVRKKDGSWKSFPYGGLINHNTLGDIIYTQNGHFWILLPRGGGLFAFDVNGTIDDTNDDQTRKFGVVDENGSLISNEVYSFAEDKNGAVWVGTNDGIAVYYNPGNVFSDQDFSARRIIVPGPNPGEGAYLLANEVVTSIFVDGGNRKWVGTEKAGVFLLSPDGIKQIHHFTTRNSPLISDNIASIAVHPKTGEVFIATNLGLVSYRADATEGQSSFQNVLVFPNPVRPDFDGVISVTGLMEETVVKITDINGYLVYETMSTGGQATWDGRNLRGQRVKTGVYLIFLSNRDGSETHVSKLLFIH